MHRSNNMASRDILTNDVSFAAIDRAVRMPAWFEVAPRASATAAATSNVALDTDWCWLDTSDGGVEVIEHHVPAELLAAFFGTSGAGSVRA
jgi:hypothetical protein